MASPGLSPQLAEVESRTRLLTGMCLGCGKRDCAGCWDPLSEQVRPAKKVERVWSLPLSEADRRSIRADVIRRRQRLGIPTRDLAQHAGVTRQAVSHWERDNLFAISDQRIIGIVEFLDEAECEVGEADLPSPEALRSRMLKVLDRYQIARKDLAARAGVSRGCIQSIAEAPNSRHYRETLAIVRALDEICSAPPPRQPAHGTSTVYNRGCRCSACRAAQSRRMKEWKAKAAEVASADPSQVPHGETGYKNWRCRCPVCKAAGSEDNRRQRLRRKALASTLPGPSDHPQPVQTPGDDGASAVNRTDINDQGHNAKEAPNHG
ncbi:helix-turn-helix domain-containing protein [Streptomyces sp.]|uniref:helix-turn-helix domain-containing protein n=1 Tax=Streptomyces sp. TaxID=1931 RepID=UPI002F91C0C3